MLEDRVPSYYYKTMKNHILIDPTERFLTQYVYHLQHPEVYMARRSSWDVYTDHRVHIFLSYLHGFSNLQALAYFMIQCSIRSAKAIIVHIPRSRKYLKSQLVNALNGCNVKYKIYVDSDGLNGGAAHVFKLLQIDAGLCIKWHPDTGKCIVGEINISAPIDVRKLYIMPKDYLHPNDYHV